MRKGELNIIPCPLCRPSSTVVLKPKKSEEDGEYGNGRRKLHAVVLMFPFRGIHRLQQLKGDE